MTASYPGSVKTFTTHVNVTEIIDAGHPNALQEEVAAIETVIGTSPSVATAATAAGWANTATDYGTINSRLANIEKGVVADSHTQYVKNSVITATGDLLVGTGAGTAGRIAIGANGTYLTSNGTTAVWSAGLGVQGATGPQGPQGGVTNAPAYTTSSQTASAGQTVFSVTYKVGYLVIFVNGVRLNSSDFTATDGTSVTIGTALKSGDIVDFEQITLGLGAQGTSGAQGPSGSNGAQGTAGAQGATGSNGSSIQGTTGAQGATGSSGQFTSTSGVTSGTLAAQNQYFIDSSSTAVTVTLPATASVGDTILIFDQAGNATTNNITVNSNSLKINGSVQNLIINVNYAAVVLVYMGTGYGWRVS